MDYAEWLPIKILLWMWQMRRWSRRLLISAISITALNIILSQFKLDILLSISFVLVVLLWTTVLLVYIVMVVQYRKKLDSLIKDGIYLRSILQVSTDDALQRYYEKTEAWQIDIEETVRGTQYESVWGDNIGLDKPQDETVVEGYEEELRIKQNWLDLRLIRLKEIRDKLL